MRWQGARVGLLIPCVLTACGRIAFDASSDADSARLCAAPSGHDEDGDGTDDACDVCPHLADDQLDGDGDGVGDACDPEPGNPRQQLVLFDPMLDNRNGWALNMGTIDAAGGHLSGLSNFATFSRPFVDGTYSFLIGGTVTAAGPVSHKVSINLRERTQNRYFYCELYTQGVSRNLAFTYTLDGTMFVNETITPRTSDTLGASGVLKASVTASDGRCDATWNGETSTAPGTKHGIVPDQVVLGADKCDATIDWFVEIQTN